MIHHKTPAVGTELVLDGKECIVARGINESKVWCEGCAFKYPACIPIKWEAKITCTGVIFMPKLEYLKRQMRGEL